ncbi:hypothetical protein TWF694_011461 [Orbilia ellipsospora]|uniref:DUF21-domain-containing protein n=1 Tax=Orbilia ellipsospora TaxID=2528407 RepID=A0AAV9X7X3_9PEZI
MASISRRSHLANSIVKCIFLLTAQLPTLASYPLSSSSKLGRRGSVFSIWEHPSHDDHDVEGDPDDPQFWVYLGVSVFLVVLGGVFAGLTLGLMGQDEIYLQVIAQSGEDKEQRHARQVLRLLRRGKHWVLVTLLLGNVITNETLPIVLDRSLGGGWPAVLSSTILIVIFGEIIPQSVCVRYGLSIGAHLSPFVLSLMYLMYPVAYPTAMLLDWILGEDHGTTYKKAGLKTLVTLHKTLGEHPAERLNQDEVTIITAVLDLKEKPVGSVMTPMEDVFTMSADTVLDEKTMDKILSKGYSRIPIHAPGEPTNFVGMLLVKILITYDPEDAMKVADFPLATLPETAPETSCLDIVNFFQEGKSHMVLVSESPGENYGALGVITLEDVIEELIGEEIVDESDVYVDVHKAIRRMNPAPISRRNYGTIFPAESTIKGKTNQAEEILDVVAPATNAANATVERQKVAMTPGEGDKLLGNDDFFGSSGGKVSTGRPEGAGERRASTGVIDAEGGPRRGSKASIPQAVIRKLSGGAANIPDSLKESLKHLGPSNPAAAPRTTGLKSIKIKTIPVDGTTVLLDGDPKSATTAKERRLISFEDEVINGHGHANGGGPPPQLSLPSQVAHTVLSSSAPEEALISSAANVIKVPEQKAPRAPSPAASFKKARSGSLKERPKEVGGIRKVIVETETTVTNEGEEAIIVASTSAEGAGEESEAAPDESTSLLGKK